MFELSARQAKNIHDFQQNEIEQLASDRQFALDRSTMEHFSRIGDWIPFDRAGRVLELGCGPGRYAAMLASIGHDVVGVDPLSYDTWDMIRRRRQLELKSEVFAELLPVRGCQLRLCCMHGRVAVFQGRQQGNRRNSRVLKPGGRLIVRNINLPKSLSACPRPEYRPCYKQCVYAR